MFRFFQCGRYRPSDDFWTISAKCGFLDDIGQVWSLCWLCLELIFSIGHIRPHSKPTRSGSPNYFIYNFLSFDRWHLMAVHLPLLAKSVSINMYYLYICTYRFSAREGVVLRDLSLWMFPAIFTHSAFLTISAKWSILDDIGQVHTQWRYRPSEDDIGSIYSKWTNYELLVK